MESGFITTSYVPVINHRRYELENHIGSTYSKDMPLLNSFGRRGMRKQDVMALMAPYSVMFIVDETTRYVIDYEPGFLFDCASVPSFLVHGDLNKFGQAVELAALVHDTLFATKVLPFDECNSIFEGLLHHTGLLSKFTIKLYKLGVSSPIGKRIYNEGDPAKYWNNGLFKIWRFDGCERTRIG